MPLPLAEIRSRAFAFAREWVDAFDEIGEAQPFLEQFFNVFGITRRRVATFEKRVHRRAGGRGRIDLLWRGQLLIEMKSRGEDLERAYRQATDYFDGLEERDLPRWIVVCDFARFRLYDLDTGDYHQFALEDFPERIDLFGFISGWALRRFEEQAPVNAKAAERMGRLHDALKAQGYDGHKLEVLLVRLVFCLFAEDTGIFPEVGAFRSFIEGRTVAPSERVTYIVGNPPFIGAREKSAEQSADVRLVFGAARGAGELDYVTCWYRKAADYIAGSSMHRSGRRDATGCSDGLASSIVPSAAMAKRSARGLPGNPRVCGGRPTSESWPGGLKPSS